MRRSFREYSRGREAATLDAKYTRLCEGVVLSGLPFEEFWRHVAFDTFVEQAYDTTEEFVEILAERLLQFSLGDHRYLHTFSEGTVWDRIALLEDSEEFGPERRARRPRNEPNDNFKDLDNNGVPDDEEGEDDDAFSRASRGDRDAFGPESRGKASRGGNDNFAGLDDDDAAAEEPSDDPFSRASRGDRDAFGPESRGKAARGGNDDFAGLGSPAPKKAGRPSDDPFSRASRGDRDAFGPESRGKAARGGNDDFAGLGAPSPKKPKADPRGAALDRAADFFANGGQAPDRKGLSYGASDLEDLDGGQAPARRSPAQKGPGMMGRLGKALRSMFNGDGQQQPNVGSNRGVQSPAAAPARQAARSATGQGGTAPQQGGGFDWGNAMGGNTQLNTGKQIGQPAQQDGGFDWGSLLGGNAQLNTGKQIGQPAQQDGGFDWGSLLGGNAQLNTGKQIGQPAQQAQPTLARRAAQQGAVMNPGGVPQMGQPGAAGGVPQMGGQPAAAGRQSPGTPPAGGQPAGAPGQQPRPLSNNAQAKIKASVDAIKVDLNKAMYGVIQKMKANRDTHGFQVANLVSNQLGSLLDRLSFVRSSGPAFDPNAAFGPSANSPGGANAQAQAAKRAGGQAGAAPAPAASGPAATGPSMDGGVPQNTGNIGQQPAQGQQGGIDLKGMMAQMADKMARSKLGSRPVKGTIPLKPRPRPNAGGGTQSGVSAQRKQQKKKQDKK
jgi:hypothetical protein